MRRIFSLFIILFIVQSIAAQELDPKKMRYIEQYRYWAMDEQIRTGVPASISLAQGILETASGTSELCTEANNHFGIKCKKEWTGENFLHDDDRRSECFRKYKTAKDSYLDHSDFLRTRAHYNFLFDLDITDYKAWCHGLRKAGYATNPQYALRLIELIETYNLQQYTIEALELAQETKAGKEVVPMADAAITENTDDKVEINVENKPISNPASAERPEVAARKVIYDKLMIKNGRSGFWARKGDYLLPEAIQYNIRYAKLLDINDLADEPLYADMFIYLKKKSKKGDRMYHRVKEGETMHSISQETGVILKYLYVYNNLFEGEEPAVGEKIYLQGRSDKTPKLVNETGTTQLATKRETFTLDTVETKVASKPSVKSEKLKKVEELEPVKSTEPIKEVVKVAEKIVEQEKEVVKETPNPITTMQKEEDAVILKPADVTPPKEVATIAEKNIEANTSTSSNQSTLHTDKKDSPILDVVKAKKVEQLMGDGSNEVQQYYDAELKQKYNAQQQQEQKVIPEPVNSNQEVIIQKQQQNDLKRKNNERKYDEKNVSDDVKDLKKKFDSLIYEEESK